MIHKCANANRHSWCYKYRLYYKHKLLNSTTISRTVHNFYFYGEKIHRVLNNTAVEPTAVLFVFHQHNDCALHSTEKKLEL